MAVRPVASAPSLMPRRNMAQLDVRFGKGDRYRLVKPLGAGGHGRVYRARDLHSGEDIAVKLEHASLDPSFLKQEFGAYEELRGRGIPRVFWYHEQEDYNVMTMELLGPSLQDLFVYCERTFSVKTVLLLADKLLCNLQHVHSKGIVHRDVKPENFLMGTQKNGNAVYTIDLGLHATSTGKSLCFIGTSRYASRNGHAGDAQDDWDDHESLSYMLLYFLCGSLPWQGLEEASDTARNELIWTMKRDTTAQELCKSLQEGIVRDTFVQYVTYIRERKSSKPSCALLRRKFQKLFSRLGYKYDNVYDWTIKRYSELYQHTSACRRTSDTSRTRAKQARAAIDTAGEGGRKGDSKRLRAST